jgi:hypothetical protein
MEFNECGGIFWEAVALLVLNRIKLIKGLAGLKKDFKVSKVIKKGVL